MTYFLKLEQNPLNKLSLFRFQNTSSFRCKFIILQGLSIINNYYTICCNKMILCVISCFFMQKRKLLIDVHADYNTTLCHHYHYI